MPFSRQDAKDKPLDSSKGFISEMEEAPEHQCDRYRYSKWHRTVMANLRQIEFRRLDVTLHVMSRFQVHDAFLKKKLKGIIPDSGKSGDEFLFMLSNVLAADLSLLGPEFAVRE